MGLTQNKYSKIRKVRSTALFLSHLATQQVSNRLDEPLWQPRPRVTFRRFSSLVLSLGFAAQDSVSSLSPETTNKLRLEERPRVDVASVRCDVAV